MATVPNNAINESNNDLCRRQQFLAMFSIRANMDLFGDNSFNNVLKKRLGTRPGLFTTVSKNSLNKSQYGLS